MQLERAVTPAETGSQDSDFDERTYLVSCQDCGGDFIEEWDTDWCPDCGSEDY